MLLFENWLMKHKWATLVNMQQEIYYQKSQSFYPSEPFTLHHINMRHPVLIAEGKEIFEKFKKLKNHNKDVATRKKPNNQYPYPYSRLRNKHRGMLINF